MGRVYLETSFFSACVWERQDTKSVYRRQQSRLWWVHQRSLHELFISGEVTRELSSPGFRHREAAIAMASQAKVLAVNEDVEGLARILVREKVMPGPAGGGDAVHVAAAIVHGMDFLLTWNQKHLANINKVPHLREVCRRVGYLPPDLTTPDALWKLSEEEWQ
jgi:hypothetical protein